MGNGKYQKSVLKVRGGWLCSSNYAGITLNKIAKPDSLVQPHKCHSVGVLFIYLFVTFKEGLGFFLFCFVLPLFNYFHLKGQKKDSASLQARIA